MASPPHQVVARRSRRRAALRLVALVAVIVLSVGWWLAAAFASGSDVSWAVARIDDLVIGVDVEGTLASRDSSQLTPPQVEGVYDFTIRFMAPEGTEAELGAPVLAFDTSELDQRLLQLQAEAEGAGKNIEKLDADTKQQLMTLALQHAEAEATLSKARLKNDVPDDLRSANQAEIDQLDVEVAEVQVVSLQGQLAAAETAAAAQRQALEAQRDRAVRLVSETETAIESLTVKSPRAGTVIYSTNWRGEKKKVGDSTWRHERVIEVPNLELMMARGELDEADAGRVQQGQSVTLRLDAHPDLQYDARIESIAMTVQRKRASRSPLKVVRLDLALDETDTERMRPGMRFRGTVEAERIVEVLVIPAHAVFPSDDGPVVYRQTMFGHERVRVELGARNAFAVQVLNGLEAGDQVAETRPEA